MLKRNRDGKNQMNIKESNHATEKQASNSTEVPSSSARLGALCCMIGATSWGFSGTCGEALFSSYPIDAAWVTALRMLGAGTILLLAAAAKGKLPVRALVQDKKAMAQMMLFSFLGLVLSQYAYLNAIKMDQFGNGDGAAEFIDYFRGGLCMRGRTYIAHETDVFLYLSGILWSLADRDGRKTGRHGTDGEGTFLGNHGRCRRSCVFPAFKKSGEAVGKYSCNRDGNVYRRRAFIGSRPHLGSSGGAGRSCRILSGCACDTGKCGCVYSFFKGSFFDGTGARFGACLPGTADGGVPVSGLAEFRFYTGRVDWIRLYSGDGFDYEIV